LEWKPYQEPWAASGQIVGWIGCYQHLPDRVPHTGHVGSDRWVVAASSVDSRTDPERVVLRSVSVGGFTKLIFAPARTMAEGTLRITLLAYLFATVLWAQVPSAWHDPSKHQVQFVTVEDGVQLEVLDWGGTGRPVVLLAGYNTAHVYDGFAEELAQTNHVYGITRRGYGMSSRPDLGYTARHSAEDVLRVLDSLQVVAPVLAGHSFGGQDLTTLGATNPDRIAGLIYLNSAEDPTLVWSDYGLDVSPSQHQEIMKDLPAEMRSRPSPADKTYQAYRGSQSKRGVAVPESELRQLFTANTDGTMGKYPAHRVREAIYKGRQKPNYAAIQAPILALFAMPPTLDEQIDRYQPQNASERAAMEHDRAVTLAIKATFMRDLQTGAPGAQITKLQGANFYIFLSNEADVLREMRTFITQLR